jgi:PAS domain S-box-containing protein
VSVALGTSPDGDGPRHALHLDIDRIFDLSLDLMCIVDAPGRFVRVAGSSAKLLGYLPEELVGRRFIEFVHPDDVARTIATYQDLVGGTHVLEFENRYLRKDGATVDFNWSASWSHEAQLSYAVARDVTLRKRAEAMRESQRVLLQKIVTGAALSTLLEEICRMIEAFDVEARCAIALTDVERQRIGEITSVSMPRSLLEGLEGAETARATGTCSVALRTGMTACSADIESDPQWLERRNIALAHGLRSSWSTPVFGATGQIIASIGIYYPIAKGPTTRQRGLMQAAVSLVSVAIEHSRAEQQLKQSVTRLELAQSIARLGYWERDIASDRIRLYGEAHAILGVDPNATFSLADLVSLVLPEDRQLLVAGYFAGGEADLLRPLHLRLKRPDRTLQHIYAQRRPVHDAEGKPIRVIGTLQDVTERQQVDAERQHYLQQLSFLAAAARKVNSVLTVEELLDVITDIARDLVDAHAALSRIHPLDGSRGELQSRSHSELYREEDLSELLDSSARAAELMPNAARVPRSLTRGRAEEGSLWSTGVLAVPMVPAAGRELGSILVADKREGDFTENDQRVLAQLADLAAVGLENARLYASLEDRVRQRTQELEQSNRELEAFSYSVSHDLRGPLRAISGFTGLLRDRHYDTIDAESRRYIDRVLAGTQRMSSLIDDLLELGRVTRMEIRRELVDLSELARVIVAHLTERAPERIATVTIEPRMKVWGDLRLMEIVLENLLSNAWKFTSGRPVTEIHFGAVRDGGAQPAFYVRDNGVGFDPRYAANLFGVFQRLHATSEFPGTGVGLATVQRIVHRHGGRVWAEAETHRGATFYFTIATG